MTAGRTRGETGAGFRRYGNDNEVELNAIGRDNYAVASPYLKALFDRIHDGVVARVQCDARSERSENTLSLKTGKKTSVAMTIRPDDVSIGVDLMIVSSGKHGLVWQKAETELACGQSMLAGPNRFRDAAERSRPVYQQYRVRECEQLPDAIAMITTTLRHWEKL